MVHKDNIIIKKVSLQISVRLFHAVQEQNFYMGIFPDMRSLRHIIQLLLYHFGYHSTFIFVLE